ncbi:MAG: hypothetical protein LBV19_05175 [Streptococcaceae bacterium]|nr:hypothetical protein [Streptococcaceae bacterium]
MNFTFQNSKVFSLKRIALLALFVAVCVVARLSFTWIPNFTPVTTIVLLICFNFGLANALVVANVMLVATGVYLGMGYWVFEQMLCYSLILLIYYFLLKIGFFRKLLSQMVIAFLLGLLYGFLISICEVFIFRINFFWIYYSAGIPFDLMHASGDFLFMLVLSKPFAVLKERFVKFDKV